MSNKSIALDIKTQLLGDVELKNSIRSEANGQILAFIRDGELQKLRYPTFKLDSQTYLADDYDDIELPQDVYRRFCIILAEMINQVDYPMEYGYLTCNWTFEQIDDQGNWKDICHISFEREIHLNHRTKH